MGTHKVYSFQPLPSFLLLSQKQPDVSFISSLLCLSFFILVVGRARKQLSTLANPIFQVLQSVFSWEKHAGEQGLLSCYLSNLFVSAKSLQSYLILCDPTDCSSPGSSATGFSRQEYWSERPCPPPGDPPDPVREPASLASPGLASGFFTTSATREAHPRCTKEVKKCLFFLF